MPHKQTDRIGHYRRVLGQSVNYTVEYADGIARAVKMLQEDA